MLQTPPAIPGMREEEIDTPALVIDLDAFEYNLDHMAALLAPTGVKLRAHAKTHKSPVIAKLQMARGAVGQCVQKVAEAEVLAWGGIPDILVSNEVVGAAKLARLCALAGSPMSRSVSTMRPRWRRSRPAAADAGIAHDGAGGDRCWSGPLRRARRPRRGRTGKAHRCVETSDFGGLQAYQGSAQHKRTVRGAANSDRRCGRCRRVDR